MCQIVKRFVIALGIVLSIAGLGLGLWDLSVRTSDGTVNCGGAFDDLAHGDAFSTDYKNESMSRMSRYLSAVTYFPRFEGLFVT